MKSFVLVVISIFLVSQQAYALSAIADRQLNSLFRKSWIEHCSSYQTDRQNRIDMPVEWSNFFESKNYAYFTAQETELDQIFDQEIASTFLDSPEDYEIFKKGNFAKASSDYLDRLYCEIIDLYIDLTEKELEKRSGLKPSYIKKLVALFNSVTAI